MSKSPLCPIFSGYCAAEAARARFCIDVYGGQHFLEAAAFWSHLAAAFESGMPRDEQLMLTAALSRAKKHWDAREQAEFRWGETTPAPRPIVWTDLND